MRIRCEHRIPLGAEEFWERIHSEDYEARCARALGLSAYDVLERREEPGEIYRRIRVVPPIPASMAALLERLTGSKAAGYTEEQWRSRAERLVRWKMTPVFMAERARIEGVVRVEPEGAQACRRILDGEVSIRLFGAGGLLERAIVSQVEEAYAKTAEVAGELDAPGADPLRKPRRPAARPRASS